MNMKGPNSPSFRFHDRRQKRIYERLVLVGEGPAAFYLDACRIITTEPPFETTTHLVGHCLREIESALRDVLKPAVGNTILSNGIPLPEGLILRVPGFPTRELDDNEPTPTRQAELRTAYQENIAARQPPYADVAILTRGEFSWIMGERGWSGDLDLKGADLSGADLSDADLQGASLQLVNLQKAKLYGSKLAGTNFKWADLRGADLTGARMDNETIIAEIKIDSRTQFGDVAWNGVPLTQVSWEPISRIGDEVYAKEPLWEQPGQGTKVRKPRGERIREYQRAARTYRSLALALKEQGLTRLTI